MKDISEIPKNGRKRETKKHACQMRTQRILLLRVSLRKEREDIYARAKKVIRDDEKTKKSTLCDNATTRGWTRGREEEGSVSRSSKCSFSTYQSKFRRLGEEKS